MKARKTQSTTEVFEEALAAGSACRYILRLYVAGATERSRRAIARARRLCETELAGHAELEVIDIYQQPLRARAGQIVATPTLVRELPGPVLRLVGALSDIGRIALQTDGTAAS